MSQYDKWGSSSVELHSDEVVIEHADGDSPDSGFVNPLAESKSTSITSGRSQSRDSTLSSNTSGAIFDDIQVDDNVNIGHTNVMYDTIGLNNVNDTTGHTNVLYDMAESRSRQSSTHVDQIEVSLVDDEVDSTQVLTNATDFLFENNQNFTLTWDEAAHKADRDLDLDPRPPPVPGVNKEYFRFRLRRVIESFPFRIVTLLLIVLDLIFVIIDLNTPTATPPSLSPWQTLDLILSIYFVIEVSLRIFALTPPFFFAHWFNVVDFAVVLVTLIVACTTAATITSPTGFRWTEHLALLTVLRFVRVLRIIRLITEKKQVEIAARQMISQNKRRFQHAGHDLDLTYVTPRVIATSFPSSGLWALFRNPIEHVAAFLDERHKDHYRLYNLCSEKTYDESYFHNRVQRVCIDDHNVPSVQQMREFASDVARWLASHPDNVVVVHCKGGKGRTGTMICVWLVEAEAFANARQSLQYFGQRRTDTNVGNKFQGVETPSQSRYVGYFEEMKNRFGGQVPEITNPVVLRKIELFGMRRVGRGDGSDFWFNVDLGRANQVFSAHLGFNRNCTVSVVDSDVVTVEVLNCPKLEGDVRVLFQSSSQTVPRGYENCPFYFWFNTAFLQEDQENKEGFVLDLSREELDNPHKEKTWHCFAENFRVKVYLDRA